ncbi:MAG: hypothetical protein A2W00_05345 [Candidatus Eisenbacteria bacterium RBG_16_71_46]|nr:MAG: hypothetical protein A2W00_05345 [Candidatus Eisenbacteria bacterium RBG_16_71_46]
MSTDWTRVVEALFPAAGGEPALVLRTAIVDTENVDGTVDLLLSGVVIPDVPVVDGAVTAEDSVVTVLVSTGTLLVLGSIRT